MPYKITTGPLTRGHAAAKVTFEKETAMEAWGLVDGLRGNQERVTILHPDGYPIDWLELEALADAEQSDD